MTYTVGDLAGLARVSVRTLHHYDEIGLLRPSGRSGAGYRLYTAGDLQRLQHLSLEALQDRWRTNYGQRAPGRLGAEFLRRALAYRLQETALGGLSRQAQLRLKAWSQRPREDDGRARSMPMSVMIKSGTRFVREWQGETHEVLAIESGTYIYKSKIFRSLTVIAREITGTHQSGPRFFGLRRQDIKSQGLERSHV